MTDLEVLRVARELLSDPSRWTTGELARDGGYNAVDPRSPDACCWCLMGAVVKHGDQNQIERLRSRFRMITGEAFVGNYNDDQGHKAVLKVLDRAIEAQS